MQVILIVALPLQPKSLFRIEMNSFDWQPIDSQLNNDDFQTFDKKKPFCNLESINCY